MVTSRTRLRASKTRRVTCSTFGKKAPGKPNNWKVADNKLYLNLNDNDHMKWSADIGGFVVKADAQWSMIAND